MVSVGKITGVTYVANFFKSKNQIDYEKQLREKEKKAREETYRKEMQRARKEYETERLKKIRVESRNKANWNALPTSEKTKRVIQGIGKAAVGAGKKFMEPSKTSTPGVKKPFKNLDAYMKESGLF